MIEQDAIPVWQAEREKNGTSFRQALGAGLGVVIALLITGAFIAEPASPRATENSTYSQEGQTQSDSTPELTATTDGGVGDADSVFLVLLEELTVEPELERSYDRSLFSHWLDLDNDGCTAREEVLLAESIIPITGGSDCDLAGGLWVSVYDSIQTADPSEFDIDHFIPLAEAWASGAADWDSDTRMRFANDLDYSMSLIAVSASSNRSRGASDPAEWLPENQDYRCEYVFNWVNVKYRWDLSIDPGEKEAIEELWRPCSVEELDSAVIATRAEINKSATGSATTESGSDVG